MSYLRALCRSNNSCQSVGLTKQEPFLRLLGMKNVGGWSEGTLDRESPPPPLKPEKGFKFEGAGAHAQGLWWVCSSCSNGERRGSSHISIMVSKPGLFPVGL